MYIANVNEDGFENNPYLDRVREIAAKEGAVVVPVCAAIESEIAELDDEEKVEFLQDLGIEEPGIEPRNSCGLRTFKSSNLFYCWRKRSTSLDSFSWSNRTKSSSSNPHRL